MTMAPKGQLMLKVIGEGAKCDHGIRCLYRSRLSTNKHCRCESEGKCSLYLSTEAGVLQMS